MTDLATAERTKSSAKDYLSIIRPANSVMVGFAVLVGIAVVSAGKDVFTVTTLLGFITGFSISSFSMITNDIYDYEVDRINQPSRPIPSGRVSISNAKVYAAPFLIAGLAAAALIGPLNLGIAAIFAVVGWFYNFRGKKYGLAGNSLVALSLAIPYIFGSIAVGVTAINLAYLLALTSFLAGIGREVLKGIADVEGDKVRGIHSVAMTSGISTAKAVAAGFFLAAVASSSLPLFSGLLGRAFPVYAGLILIPDVLFAYLSIRTLAMREASQSLKLKQIALLGMLLGLVSYLVAGVLV